ncbi:MAG: VWA domain-containing protein [Candidatus Pacebacteria bacterium]|nr:VWA domain-containing protein [Candidatus Paceibacterota bacterium]
MQSSAYEELHSQTQLKELQSILGTIAMGEGVLAMIPEEDKEQLQELSQAQQETDEASNAAQQAQANADATQQLADAAQGQDTGESQPEQSQSQAGQPQPSQQESSQEQSSNGSGQMTAEQAREIANQLAEQAAKAKANAKMAQQKAEKAKSRTEELSEALLGKPDSQEAFEKQRELARIGLAAAKKAHKEVKEISDTIEMWGLEAGELTRESISEVLEILERIKKNPVLKKFSSLLGRLRKIAARKARSKDSGESVRTTATETGRDLKRAVPAELIALTNPALRVKAQMRWARGELRLRGQKTKHKLGHGPVIVCEDASGSMGGSKQQWAKALILAMAHYAKIQKRSFGWIMFDSRVQAAKTYPKGVLSAKDLLEIAESRAGGGTDFESPLRKAIEMIKNEGLKKADILLVTDGMCAVSEEFLKELLTVKKALEVNIFTVLVNVGETTDKTVQEFSDRIIPISDLSAEEAEKKIIWIL